MYLGVRYLDLTESFNVAYASTNPVAGTSVTMHDDFGTRNQFYGAQVGGKIGWYPGRLSFELIAKLALGNMHQTVFVNGQNSGFNTTGNSAGGIFTQPSNISQLSTDNFAAVPQGQLKVNFELFPNCYVGLGYDFLFISRVVRPAMQIDTSVALNQPPNTPLNSTHPVTTVNETDFWAHGLSISLQYKY
jgi:hypothetical protein